MVLNANNAVVVIYVAGVFISAVLSFRRYFILLHLEPETSTSWLANHLGLKSYLAVRVVFWPYYIFRQNPVVLLSELLFRHYGNTRQSYFGLVGAKNFFADLLKGRQRYKNVVPYMKIVPIDSKNVEFNSGEIMFCFSHAELLFAKYQEEYLLRVTYLTLSKNEYLLEPSRFDIDSCERLSRQTFTDKIASLNPGYIGEALNLLERKRGS